MDFASPFLLALLRLNRTKHRLTKYASLYSIASLSATSMQQLVHHKTKNLLFSQIRASEGMRHLIHNGVLCGFSAVDRQGLHEQGGISRGEMRLWTIYHPLFGLAEIGVI